MAIKKHSDGTSHVSVPDRPTTMGGVTASFYHAGGRDSGRTPGFNRFWGHRVIAQTIGEISEGFQSLEFLLEHGMIDRIVKREELREGLVCSGEKIHERRQGILSVFSGISIPKEEKSQQENSGKQVQTENEKRTAWDRVETARSKKRLTALDYMETVFDGFWELQRPSFRR